MHRLGLAVAAAGVFALAGCASRAIIYDPVYTQGYYEGALEYAASKGELRTEIDGNPVSIPKSDFDRIVTSTMKGANYGPEVVYTTQESERTRKPFKVVMVFNGPIDLSPKELCAEDRKRVRSGPLKEGVSLQAVFCQWERALTEAEGTAYDVKSTDDPRFRELVREVTASLFPAYDYQDIGGDSGRNN